MRAVDATITAAWITGGVGEAAISARKAIDPALDEAEETDKVIVDLIRDELRSRPEAVALPVSRPDERPRFRRRR